MSGQPHPANPASPANAADAGHLLNLGSPAASEPAGVSIGTVIEPRERDLGDGFSVRRLLPDARLRNVGPFVFFDHFGPTQLAPGKGLDVRPHPHIGLATVTYLFEGEIIHRDSLGYFRPIHPGAINWMTASRGIAHSERMDPKVRASGSSLHGLQLWLALPLQYEETPPAFHHHPAATLPELAEPGVHIRVLAGKAFGLTSPLQIFSPLVYLDLRLEAGATIDLPTEPTERGIYIIEGSVACEGQSFGPRRLLSFHGGCPVQVRGETATRLVFIGGDALDAPRHVWWNFVSSSQERIEQAKRDWRERRGDPAGPFPLVPGDEADFIPLPES